MNFNCKKHSFSFWRGYIVWWHQLGSQTQFFTTVSSLNAQLTSCHLSFHFQFYKYSHLTLHIMEDTCLLKKQHKTRGWKHICVGQIFAVVAVVLVIIFWSFHPAPDIMRLEVKLSKTEISLRLEGLSMLFKWGRSIHWLNRKKMATYWKSSGNRFFWF